MTCGRRVMEDLDMQPQITCDKSYNCPADIDHHEWDCEALASYRRTVAYEDIDVEPGDEG